MLMRRLMHWVVVVVVVLHGLIHLLGAAKGFGWTDVKSIAEPIGHGMGAVWLAAGVLVVIAGVLLANGVHWWWAVGVYGPHPSRLFSMDATMFGLPVDVLHTYAGAIAPMRVKACSLVPIVNMGGPDMDRAETVTVFNDLCILAPAALIHAPITWQPIDAEHVRGTFPNGAQTVAAELTSTENMTSSTSCPRIGFAPRRTARPRSHSGGPRLSGNTAPSTPAGSAPRRRRDGTPPPQKPSSPTSTSP
jgi:hypothetical protein